ncbi:hypothetical protein LEMLEM_LOCUS17740 [Lemmus lemmus]
MLTCVPWMKKKDGSCFCNHSLLMVYNFFWNSSSQQKEDSSPVLALWGYVHATKTGFLCVALDILELAL